MAANCAPFSVRNTFIHDFETSGTRGGRTVRTDILDLVQTRVGDTVVDWDLEAAAEPESLRPFPPPFFFGAQVVLSGADGGLAMVEDFISQTETFVLRRPDGSLERATREALAIYDDNRFVAAWLRTPLPGAPFADLVAPLQGLWVDEAEPGILYSVDGWSCRRMMYKGEADGSCSLRSMTFCFEMDTTRGVITRGERSAIFWNPESPAQSDDKVVWTRQQQAHARRRRRFIASYVWVRPATTLA
mmetsp:Transcript_130860/g.298022  ORF Transcript_130860/g.298022 Transcript_130860/m.298022 type:complete len:245 (+) Transcript_130860:49-783(+)|eukprot:CAMPEP_0204339496 /NCGR_PEP_ID=MMETSP0469-20131031/21849_1 /ASSEMBLY_ACC=CAM_ASM_000384 /TAXON_ID=2969 /ORGANISM="Oxyrrhis marina" /LENGTH=244 /DNA_ID=CAMNT_0051323855 /DNA_START=13 /DNA_END=747 /DNA_ORIENTATION=+